MLIALYFHKYMPFPVFYGLAVLLHNILRLLVTHALCIICEEVQDIPERYSIQKSLCAILNI